MTITESVRRITSLMMITSWALLFLVIVFCAGWRGDLDVAFTSDIAQNPGTFHVFTVHLKDVLNTLQVATNLVSLHVLDADGLEYVDRGGMI